jgi:protein O-mannosyl-transferase
MNQPKVKPKVSIPAIFPFTFKIKCVVLVVLSFVFYANTLQNGYLLDDNLTIVSNDYVQQGFSGIPKILSSDSYASFMHKTGLDKHKLSGGRYRPLSIVIFAIEHGIFGESTFLRHLVNLLLFSTLLIVLLWFMDTFLFRTIAGGSDIAFLTTLLFAIHPIHTEVVANVKSLDEILSLLLITLTFIFSLRYFKNNKKQDLLLALASYFLSLLAKEYAITLLVLLPVLFYLFGNKTPREALLSSLPYYVIFIIYLIFRIRAVGLPAHVVNNDVVINPYLFATPSQVIASKLFVLGKYLYMLFIPYPLSYDYNYAAIPYSHFSDISVWVSILIYIGIAAWGGWLLYKKNILAFPVLFFLLNLALVSNFLMDIGATMGERLIFHSSLGFIMVLSYGVFACIKKWSYQMKRTTLYTSLGILVIVCGAETLKRNTQWNTIYTLVTHDVKTVPNSILANDYAAVAYLYLADTEKDSAQFFLRNSIACAKKSISIMHTYSDGYIRLGLAYSQLAQFDSAAYYLQIDRTLNPRDTGLRQLLANTYVSNSMKCGKAGNIKEAIRQLWKAANTNPNDAGIWYNLGGAYYSTHNYDSARFAWTRTLQLNPAYPNAANGLNALPK